MITDDQIKKDLASVWDCGGWGFTMDDLIRLSYAKSLDADQFWDKGEERRDGDVVWRSEDGTREFTRYMAGSWFRDWKSFEHGFYMAAKFYNK